MTTEEVEGKARDLLVPALGEEKADRLIAAVRDLESLDDVRALRELLGGEEGAGERATTRVAPTRCRRWGKGLHGERATTRVAPTGAPCLGSPSTGSG